MLVVDDALALRGDGTAQLNTLFSLKETHYVDLSAAVPALALRGPLPGTPQPPNPASGQETVISNLPPCIVSFSGPVSGTQVHQGGDLSIGFSVPGNYRVWFDPHPFLPAIFFFEVTEQP